MATVHDRGRRACAFDGERCVHDDRPVSHESEILRNPDHSVRVVSHQAAGDQRLDRRQGLVPPAPAAVNNATPSRETDSGR